MLAPCGQNRFITNHEPDTTQWGFNKMKSPVPLTSDHYVHSGITDKTIMIVIVFVVCFICSGISLKCAWINAKERLSYLYLRSIIVLLPQKWYFERFFQFTILTFTFRFLFFPLFSREFLASFCFSFSGNLEGFILVEKFLGKLLGSQDQMKRKVGGQWNKIFMESFWSMLHCSLSFPRYA